MSSYPFFFPCQLLECGHFAKGRALEIAFNFQPQRCLEFDLSHNAVARYRKRLLQCFGRVQCAMASCFLVQRFCIYIAFQVSMVQQFSFAVPWRIPCFLFYLYARQHLVLRYSRMPLELTGGSKSEHLAVSHQARHNVL